MRQIWKKYKVWILVGIVYTGILIYKSMRILRSFASRIQKHRNRPSFSTR